VKSRFAFGAALVSVTVVLASCAAAPGKPEVQSSAAPGARGAPSNLTAEASVFESYMRKARGIDGQFSSPAEVSQALQTGASHEPRQLEEGMIAYGAVAALQEPRFVDALRASPNRGELVRRISADPAAALALPGGEAAAARASGALAIQGEALHAQGMKVKRSAYSVQHEAWSKTPVADPRGRLAKVKQLSSAPYHADGADSARLYASMAEGGRRGGATGPAATRAVAVAALNVLGDGGGARSLMSEPRTASCLRIAKLMLYQCLAAAKPQYEDIFCLGQHAMADTGQCVAEAATRPARTVTRASYRR
jgi:hypothetical protein